MKSHTEDSKTCLPLSDFFNVRQKQTYLNHCSYFCFLLELTLMGNRRKGVE